MKKAKENAVESAQGRMTIEWMPTDSLVPYAHNPRMNDRAVGPVAESIKAFGFRVPILVDAENVVIAGHTRLKAAKKLGLATVPVIRAGDMTREQEDAFRVADNKLAELAEWDDGELMAELGKAWEHFDMSLFGFDDKPPEPGKTDIEDAPEVTPEHPKSEPGTIYRLGDHLLLCGDSTKPDDVARLMGGRQADLIVTDPPYNVDYHGGGKSKMAIENDDMGNASFVSFLTDAFRAANAALKPGGAFYVWHNDARRYEFLKAFEATGWRVREVLIWVKNALVLGRQDWQWRHESCLYGWKDGAGHYFAGDRSQTTVMEPGASLEASLKAKSKDELVEELRAIYESRSTVLAEDRPRQNDLHPTMKPVALISRLVENSSKTGQTVLDPFGGSGSTLMACQKLGRRCATIELEPKYCDAIRMRWAEYVHGEGCDLEELTPQAEGQREASAVRSRKN